MWSCAVTVGVRCLYCDLLATHKCECSNPYCAALTCDAHAWLSLNPVRLPIPVTTDNEETK